MLFKNNINIACFFNKKIEQNNFKYLKKSHFRTSF
jgi:hypothetical protein